MSQRAGIAWFKSSLACLLFILAAVTLTATAFAQPLRWDYTADPVTVDDREFPYGTLNGVRQSAAFDGFGTQGNLPAAIAAWMQSGTPTAEKPFRASIDYGRPVAVRAFVNYFYVPGNLDLRSLSPNPGAAVRVRISAADPGTTWTQVALLEDLSAAECPQILSIPNPAAHQFWQIEILDLAPGSTQFCSYEMETWTGGVPTREQLQGDPIPLPPNLTRAFEDHVKSWRHRAKSKSFVVKPTLAPGADSLTLNFKSSQAAAQARLEVIVDGQALQLEHKPDGSWRTADLSPVQLQTEQTNLGLLLKFSSMQPQQGPPVWRTVTLRMTTPNPELYYMPAYCWDLAPVEKILPCANVQTRLACLGTRDAETSQPLTLMLIPGGDRGRIGFAGGAAQNELLIDASGQSVLVTAVAGDWWKAYQVTVRDVFNFREQPQTVPVSTIQSGISRFMMSDMVWEPRLGTVRAFPVKDSVVEHFYHGFDVFNLYGVPYSIPAYWSRYVMNGDLEARKRCESVVNWLCTSGIRVHEGPAKGAFYTLQRFLHADAVVPEKPGETQAFDRPILTDQSTGAALWSLLYYRRVSGVQDPQLDTVINEAAARLINVQQPDGGWAYGHYPKDDSTFEGASSSGCIWNIWALWHLGRETGDPRYTEAARRGTEWFRKSFVETHHYHGYWEDAGPGSREGYEASIAAVAFGEMGEPELAVATAQDAMQWVFTRQIEPREASNSAALVAEQTGWPPAYYCNPMMGLAAHTAWQITGDDFWRPFALMNKAIGWWYEPETGGMIWIVESTEMAPIVNPRSESYWNDWCGAQVGSLSLRWLLREAARRTGGDFALHEETLQGTLFGAQAAAWSPPGGVQPQSALGQINAVAARTADTISIALINHGPADTVACSLDSRDVRGVMLRPRSVRVYDQGKLLRETPWEAPGPLAIGPDQTIVLTWSLSP